MEVPSKKIDIPRWEPDNRNWTHLEITHRVITNRTLNFLWAINNDFSGGTFEGMSEKDFSHSVADYKGIAIELKRSGYSRNLFLALEKIHIPHEGRMYLREIGKLRDVDAEKLFPIIRDIIYHNYKMKR